MLVCLKYFLTVWAHSGRWLNNYLKLMTIFNIAHVMACIWVTTNTI